MAPSSPVYTGPIPVALGANQRLVLHVLVVPPDETVSRPSELVLTKMGKT